MERSVCIARFQDDFQALLTTVAALSARQRRNRVVGAWTAKDVLAHIAAWDREQRRGIDELLAGQRPAYLREVLDAYNAQVVAANRHAPFAVVVQDLVEAHEALMRRIRAVSDAEWQRPTSHRWRDGSPMTVASLFRYSARAGTHYQSHARQLAAVPAADDERCPVTRNRRR